MILAEAGEAAVQLAKDAGTRLMVEWGVAGVLVLVIIVASGIIMWWFRSDIKDLKMTFTNSLDQERTACDTRHANQIAAEERRYQAQITADERRYQAQLAADEKRYLAQEVRHEKEMDAHFEMMKDWRKEIIGESRAVRDMLQMWVTRMALSKSSDSGDDEGMPSPTPKKK